LPVVSTSVGSVDEMVFNEINGFLLQIGDKIGLIEKLNVLVKDSNLRKSMGKKSREIFIEKFTEDIFINNLIKVFYKIIADK